MAAGDKNSKGKRNDYAKHYAGVDGGLPVCKEKRYGYSTSDPMDVDCEKCTVWLLNAAIYINEERKKRISDLLTESLQQK